MACVVASRVDAHESKFRHYHGGTSMAPDWESFAVIVYPDIPYATAPNTDPILLSLDVHTADPPPTNAPVIVYVHGGGGVRGDKAFAKDISNKPPYFTRKEGYLFVSVNYRLGEAGRYPNQPQDVANAVAWVHTNIAQFGGDPNRIVLAGHSSGGGIVARVATIDRFLKNAGTDLNVLKGAITLEGNGSDATAGTDTPQGKERAVALYGPNRSDWEAASPAHSVGKGKYVPPFLIFHIGTPANRLGTIGGTQADSLMLAEAMRSGGHRAEVVELIGKDHNQASTDLGILGDPLTIAVHRFLASLDGSVRQSAAK
jgi:acetyl esterase/lipase